MDRLIADLAKFESMPAPYRCRVPSLKKRFVAVLALTSVMTGLSSGYSHAIGSLMRTAGTIDESRSPLIYVDSRTELLNQLDEFLPSAPVRENVQKQPAPPSTPSPETQKQDQEEQAARAELAEAEQEKQRREKLLSKSENVVELADKNIDEANERFRELEKKVAETSNVKEKIELLEQQVTNRKIAKKLVKARDEAREIVSSARKELKFANKRVAAAKEALGQFAKNSVQQAKSSQSAQSATQPNPDLGSATQKGAANTSLERSEDILQKKERAVALADSTIKMTQQRSRELQKQADATTDKREKLRILNDKLALDNSTLALIRQRDKLKQTNSAAENHPNPALPDVQEESNSDHKGLGAGVQAPGPSRTSVTPIQPQSIGNGASPRTSISPSQSTHSRQKIKALDPSYSRVDPKTLNTIAEHAPYARLAAAAKPGSGAVTEPAGWRVIDSKHGWSGLDATVFRRSDGKVALVFHGTDLKDGRADLITDALGGSNIVGETAGRLMLGEKASGKIASTALRLNPQYAQALGFAKEVKAKHPEVVFVGHSLGGGLAHYTAGALGGKAITFNAKPLPKGTREPIETVNFRSATDPLTAAGGPWVKGGNLITVPTARGHKMAPLATEMTAVENAFLSQRGEINQNNAYAPE